MPRLEETRTVSKPRSEVFAYTVDFSNIAEWDPGVLSAERIDGGPLKEGSAFALVVRFGSQQLPMLYAITVFEPDSRVVLEGVGDKVTATDDIRFADAPGGGTRIDYVADLEFKGLLRFAAPFMGSKLRKVGADALDGLEARLGG